MEVFSRAGLSLQKQKNKKRGRERMEICDCVYVYSVKLKTLDQWVFFGRVGGGGIGFVVGLG